MMDLPNLHQTKIKPVECQRENYSPLQDSNKQEKSQINSSSKPIKRQWFKGSRERGLS